MTVNVAQSEPSSKKPGTTYLSEKLRNDIKSGKLKRGARLPAELELAKQTGLSRPIIRNIYEQLVQEGLVERIRPTGTFVRSNMQVQHTAKGLSMLYLLGLQLGVPCMSKDHFWPGSALVGLECGAHKHQDNWIYATRNLNAPNGQLIPDCIDVRKVDGVISYVLRTQADRDNLAGHLKAIGKPNVFLNECCTFHGSNAVVDDCDLGMKVIIDKLVELGHYDIQFCNIESPSTVYPYRLKAFQAALAAAHLPVYPSLFASREEARQTKGGRGEILGREILQALRKPTAIVCISDLVALDVISFLQSEGVRIPEDISIVGYDGLPESQCATPTLATIKQDLAVLGEEAVACLHKMVECEDFRGVTVKVPGGFQSGESLGPAPAAKTQ